MPITITCSNTSGNLSPARRRCREVRQYWENPSPTARHYGHVCLAILLFFILQLLKCAWDQPFWTYNIDFPGQIVAMVFVWLFLWAVQLAFCQPGEGLERFYHRYLRAPTEVLNKHMSIGFTIPFLNLISQSFAGGNQVGLLTIAFVVTGVLNALFVYAVAYHVQRRLTRLSPHRRHRGASHVLDVAQPSRRHHQHEGSLAHAQEPTRPEPAIVFPRHPATGFSPCLRGGDGEGRASPDDSFCGGRTTPTACLDRFRKHISDASTLCTLSGYAGEAGCAPAVGYGEEEEGRAGDAGRPEDALRRLESGTNGAAASPSGASRLWWVVARARQHVFLTLSIVLFLLVGLPVAALCHNDLFLDIGFLFTVWLSFTSAQTRVKQHHLRRGAQQHKKVLMALATLLNPVLWTSLFLLCYGLAKSHIHALPTATVVQRFKTGTTVSDLIAHHLPSPLPTPLFGAGDIATSILNAGIVSWGFKLFEYRGQILSRGGLTVLLTTAVVALANIIAGPLLASALGVRGPAYALSFAARSVTIALGAPAMASLGGDAGVNAVGVVVNGIVFQLVAGCFVGGEKGDGGFVQKTRRWSSVLVERSRAVKERLVSLRGDGSYRDEEKTDVDGPARHHQRLPVTGAGTTAVVDRNSSRGSSHGGSSGAVDDDDDDDDDDDCRTVAAGVTIGINAAAMGTAHLYEQNSPAAPYSALAMTMFGVFTVLFTVSSPMVVWLQGMVA